jgi:hypothetical protein
MTLSARAKLSAGTHRALVPSIQSPIVCERSTTGAPLEVFSPSGYGRVTTEREASGHATCLGVPPSLLPRSTRALGVIAVQSGPIRRDE